MGKHTDTTRKSGYPSTNSREPLPEGWVELTRKNLLPGEIVRRSYVGPVTEDMRTIIGVEIGGKREWFAKSAWTVTKHDAFILPEWI